MSSSRQEDDSEEAKRGDVDDDDDTVFSTYSAEDEGGFVVDTAKEFEKGILWDKASEPTSKTRDHIMKEYKLARAFQMITLF